MIFWICCALVLGGAAMACFVGDLRRAVLALWVCSLGVGGLYLFMGAELLAIIQWIVSTLISIAFVFYAVMFGEYGVNDRRPLPRRIIDAIQPVALGLAFTAVIWLGGGHLSGVVAEAGASFPHAPDGSSMAGQDLAVLGKALAEDHLLSLEILALTLFLVIVGSGVVARPETRPGGRKGGA